MSAIRVHDEGGVRAITLDRPERLNAVNLEMLQQLDRIITDAQDDARIGVILLRGAGRAFCAGDDLDEQAAICSRGEPALRDQLVLLQRISANLVLGTRPVVGALQGWAIGAGLSWILNCDVVFCANDARAFFPEIGYGTFPTGGASWLLPHLVGARLANDLFYTGRKLGATELEARGLVSQIVDQEELNRRAEQYASQLALLPATARASIKQALGEGVRRSFSQALEYETEACVRTTLDPETLLRMRASLERTN